MIDADLPPPVMTPADAFGPRGDIDLRDLWVGLKRSWWLPVIGGAIGLVLAAVILQFVPRTYNVAMKVTASGAPSNRLGSALGSIAAIAGVSVGNQAAASSFDLYLDRLTSRGAAETLARDQSILIEVLPRGWDPRTRQWHEPHSLLRTVVRGLEPLLGIPIEPWHPPHAAELQDYLIKKIELGRPSLKDPPITTISVDVKDPAFGVVLLTRLNADADGAVRHDSLDRASQFASYLDRRLQTVQVAEHRLAITEALSDQEKLIMAASATTPYAATIVEPPVASRLPTKPNAIVDLVIGIFLGILVGAGLAVRRSLRRG